MIKSREEHLRQMNVWTPFMLAVVFVIAGLYGVGVAIPALYDSDAWKLGMQMVAYFSFAELVSHWCMTRFTDASFSGPVSPYEVKTTEPKDCTTSFCLQQEETPGRQDEEWRQQKVGGACLDFVYETECASRNSQRHDGTNLVEPTFQIRESRIVTNNFEEETNHEDNRKRHFKSGNQETRTTCMYDNVNSHLRNSDVQLDRTRTSSESLEGGFWAWLNCSRCGYATPPRSHHCLVCQRCILKRHHHCFLTGVCIGAANQRHFLAFLFWAMVVTLFGTAHMIPYAFGPMINSGEVSYWDLIPVVILYRAILGYTDAMLFPLCVTFWIVIALTVAAIIFFFRSVVLTLLGLTDTEYAKNLKIVDQRRLSERLRFVMGENWLLNFILPFPRRTKLNEDAVNWPYIKC
ncbi:palmitoyltransferase [Elysia marginata]|uniref:Palmitoyltransferase n=1 Tax=Elysia marginata TaxID=1093978 RepID=A0AAV4EZM9_9GAST|nr:palmitoyltransferase [Elysia marginata]